MHHLLNFNSYQTSKTTRKKKDKGNPGEKPFITASAASEPLSDNSAYQGT
jgi:hypothetical protein